MIDVDLIGDSLTAFCYAFVQSSKVTNQNKMLQESYNLGLICCSTCSMELEQILSLYFEIFEFLEYLITVVR